MTRLFMDNAARLAGVVELVDAPDSKSGARNGVRVRVPPPAPFSARQQFNNAPKMLAACQQSLAGPGLRLVWLPRAAHRQILFGSVNRTNMQRVMDSDTVVS